jgi:putative ABC transport system permease protein
VGAIGAVRQAVRLPPAEAMRPEPPANYRPTLFERMGWTEVLTQPERMILRHLERRPIKSSLSVLGIALAAALIVLGSFMKDSLDYLIEAQFQLAQRQDVTVTFVEPSTATARHELQHLPGVIRGEPFRAVPVRMRFEHHSRRMAIIGLPQNSQLQRLLDDKLRFFKLPSDGLVLSAKLGELLDLKVGDRVTVEVLEGERPVREVPVVAMFSEFIGLSAYMNLASLNQLLREGSSISGEFLSVDPQQADQLYAELKETPRVASVTIKSAALNSFKDTLAENMLRMTMFNVLFSSVIAFGVVYNGAQISLSERSRELATLRVIGFTRGEISWILLGELAALTAVAIPLGLTIGYALAQLLSLALDTELYRIPAIIRPKTYLFAAVVVGLATLFSGLVVRRKLDHLDLIGVLKTRE